MGWLDERRETRHPEQRDIELSAACCPTILRFVGAGSSEGMGYGHGAKAPLRYEIIVIGNAQRLVKQADLKVNSRASS